MNYDDLIPMNIRAREGDKVIFAFPENGYKCDQEQCEELLTLGHAYTIDEIVVHRSSTDVYLKEFPNISFNSVNFADYVEVELKVYLAKFSGHWLGGEALVVAETKQEALVKLKDELESQGLGRKLTLDDLSEINTTQPAIIIIDNGDY